MLGPGDVGHRVVVRRIIGIRDNRPLFADVLGELITFGDDSVEVRTAHGPVRVPRAEITRAKRVPPRRDRGAPGTPAVPAGAVAAIERAAALAWPAPEVERLGEWLLRAAGGWTGRANSALPVGDPGRPLPAAIEEVRSWYALRALPARMNVPLPLAWDVDRALARRGWRVAPPVLVQQAPLTAVLAGCGPPDPAAGAAGGGAPGPAAVELAAEPAADWLAMVSGRKGGLPAAAISILTGPALVRFAAVRAGDGGLLAIARGAVTERRLHLGLVEVVPRARRRGLARLLTRHLAAWAAGLPGGAAAQTGYLQVEQGNTAARRLYAGLGFRTHHTYLTRTEPGPEQAGEG
jgi:N-acetylglutamate synthase